jgi:hypothetical protein
VVAVVTSSDRNNGVGFVNGFSSTPTPTTTSATPIKSTLTAVSNPQNTIPDQTLIELAQDYVCHKNGFYAPIQREAHSYDFVFRGGVIGPLNRDDYCTTMEKLGIARAFQLQPNAFGVTVDPQGINTVRLYVRYSGRQVEPWHVVGTPLVIPKPIDDDERNTIIQGPTESFCLQFDDDGKVRFFTISPPLLFGNPTPVTTGPVGAVLGLFYHVGQSLAVEAALNPYVRYVSNVVANVLPPSLAPPKTRSNPNDLPRWWIEGEGTAAAAPRATITKTTTITTTTSV